MLEFRKYQYNYLNGKLFSKAYPTFQKRRLIRKLWNVNFWQLFMSDFS